MAAFPNVTFVSAQFTAGEVFCLDELLPAGVVRVSVVCGEDHDRVVCDSSIVDRFDHLSDGPIGFPCKKSAIGAIPLFPLNRFETEIGSCGDVMEKKRKKRLIGVGLLVDMGNRSPCEFRQYLVKLPTGRHGTTLESPRQSRFPAPGKYLY